MGGNAFPGLSLIRIKREQIPTTVKFIVDTLVFDGFTYDYAFNNLMGSAGKQDSSGDLDFAINNRPVRFIGEPDIQTFNINLLAQRAREILPDGHVTTKTIRSGQFNTAWMIEGKPNNGLIQVDFIAGVPEWLKFTHFSPGKDVSPWKGVMISTMLGVLAKVHKDFEWFNEESVRTARVGWHYDLEQGLYRKWQLQLRPTMGLSQVTPDQFETKMKYAPRYPRLGYVTDPSVVLRILFDGDIERTEIDTFEKVLKMIKIRMPDKCDEIRERFLEAFSRSAGANDYSVEDVAKSDIWWK